MAEGVNTRYEDAQLSSIFQLVFDNTPNDEKLGGRGGGAAPPPGFAAPSGASGGGIEGVSDLSALEALMFSGADAATDSNQSSSAAPVPQPVPVPPAQIHAPRPPHAMNAGMPPLQQPPRGVPVPDAITAYWYASSSSYGDAHASNAPMVPHPGMGFAPLPQDVYATLDTVRLRGTKCMTGREVARLVRNQLKPVTSGDAYDEDYYFHKYLLKKTSRSSCEGFGRCRGAKGGVSRP